MKPEKTVDELLHQFLHGELSGELLSELESRAVQDGVLARRIAGELRFSELLRQALGNEEGDAGARFEASLASASLSSRELLDRIREGEASVAECDRFVRYLWESPEAIREVRRELAEDEWFREALSESRSDDAFMESLETRMWAETRNDHFVEDFAKRLERELAPVRVEEGSGDNIIPFPQSWTRTAARMGAMAAALALAAFIAAQIAADHFGAKPTLASVVKSSPDAEWSDGESPGEDGTMKSGRYHLNSGVVSMRMFSGSELTVEGPAVFEVGEDASTFVHTGIALARVPISDKGISLKSRGLSISESARLIGIDARAAHATEAIVFSEDGGICMSEGGKCRELSQFEAVKADHDRERLVDVPYNPQAFSKVWAHSSGVENNLGSVRIELPGSEISEESGEGGDVRIFVENESFRPEEDLEVDRVVAGEFAFAEANPGQQLQAKGELRSYLLQLWPSGESGDEERETSLTFDHPVVGVIYSSDRLEGSDLSVGSTLSHGGVAGRSGRGMDSGTDEILLSQDRRTLNLRHRSGGGKVEQVRVLVALN